MWMTMKILTVFLAAIVSTAADGPRGGRQQQHHHHHLQHQHQEPSTITGKAGRNRAVPTAAKILAGNPSTGNVNLGYAAPGSVAPTNAAISYAYANADSSDNDEDLAVAAPSHAASALAGAPLSSYGVAPASDYGVGSDPALDALRDALPGAPGQDYPIFAEVPETAFSCEGQVDGGFYADPVAQCQAFHICVGDGHHGLARFSFLCPNGTIFNQNYFICDWWFNFDCNQAVSLYVRNSEIAAERDAAAASESEPSLDLSSYGAPPPPPSDVTFGGFSGASNAVFSAKAPLTQSTKRNRKSGNFRRQRS